MEKKDKIINFENHLEKNLEKNGFDLSWIAKNSLSLGVAVSGGADSVSLFAALCRISEKFKVPLKALTVNHNIRSKAESGADADFVVSLGKTFRSQGFDVEVFVKELERGAVFSEAEKRGNGVEEAARFLRYQAFEEFSARENVAFVALAHNRNDQAETLIMRFLQGSGNSGLCGISAHRGIFVRPLLDVSRAQIEEYLSARKIPWRTDSTNFDTNYMRNRIRQKLVPFLNENFPGFEKALLSGSQKAFDDEAALNSLVKPDFWVLNKNCVECSGAEFLKLPAALKRRQIFAGIDLLCRRGESGAGEKSSEKVSGGRIPFLFLKDFFEAVDFSASSKKAVKKTAGNLLFCFDGNKIEIKKNELIATESSFFVIIDDDIQFSFSGCEASATLSEDKKSAEVAFCSEKDEILLKNIPVPFCVRSRQQDDFVRTAGGGKKSVSDVLSDWRVPSELKNSVPVVQELSSKSQEITAVLGSLLGFKNWIVKP